MEIKNPKQMQCYSCGGLGAWIFVVDKVVCSDCFTEFKNRNENKSKIILDGIKEDLKK